MRGINIKTNSAAHPKQIAMSVAKTMAAASNCSCSRVHNTSFYCKPLVSGNIPEGTQGKKKGGRWVEKTGTHGELETFLTAGSHERRSKRTGELTLRYTRQKKRRVPAGVRVLMRRLRERREGTQRTDVSFDVQSPVLPPLLSLASPLSVCGFLVGLLRACFGGPAEKSASN